MPTYAHRTRKKTRDEFHAGLQIFKPRRNKYRSFGKLVMSYFQRKRPDCKIESFHTTGSAKTKDCFKADGYCGHCNAVFEAIDCFYNYCLCQEARPALTKKYIQYGTKTGKWNGWMRRQNTEEECCTVVEMCECEQWKLFKSDVSVNEYLREAFTHKCPLRHAELWDKIESGALFGFVQCGIEVLEPLREKEAIFQPVFKNCKGM